MRSWRREFLGSIGEIVAAAQWVDQIASEQKLAPDRTYALRVCVEELLINILHHGGATSPKIDLTLTLIPGRIELRIEDDGKPFDVSASTPRPVNQPLERTKPGGLGIQLIHSFADRLSYGRIGEKNRVVAEFLLPELDFMAASGGP